MSLHKKYTEVHHLSPFLKYSIHNSACSMGEFTLLFSTPIPHYCFSQGHSRFTSIQKLHGLPKQMDGLCFRIHFIDTFKDSETILGGEKVPLSWKYSSIYSINSKTY